MTSLWVRLLACEQRLMSYRLLLDRLRDQLRQLEQQIVELRQNAG